MKIKITAIIPIKHHSSRVPGKNYRLINGKPLYWYIIQTLLNTHEISQIVIDTDSPVIIDGIPKHFGTEMNQKKVIVYGRPESLQGDDVSTNKLLINVIKELNLNSDHYIHTHTTNPLLSSHTISSCIHQFINEGIPNEYDSLFTVKQYHTRFYKRDGTPINHDPENLIPTQELDPYFEENSCLYIAPKETILKYGRRIGNKPMLYVMSDIESTDIDWEQDFTLAQILLSDYAQQFIKRKSSHQRKAVLITGVMGGIGSELAKQYKSNGFTVIGTDIHKKLGRDINENNNSDYYFNADLSNPDKVIQLCENIKDLISNSNGTLKLSVIINNAAYQVNKSLENTTLKDTQTVFNVNLLAPYRICSLLINELKSDINEQDSYGSVINISSVHSQATSKNVSAYATTKGGILTMTKAMALELIEHGIRVNAIIPGAIDTPILRNGLHRGHLKGKSEDELLRQLELKHPTQKIGTPKDIANTALFLSDNSKSSYVIGQSIIVDGGVLSHLSSE